MFLCALVAASVTMSWIPQPSPTRVSLRGLSVVSPDVIWASGGGGTWLLTTDCGAHWQTGIVPGADKLDFRDVEAWSASDAVLLASGEGAQSRIYETVDGGHQWTALFTNPDARGFFDAISFWDRQHGIVLGDPVDGRFVLFITDDGGRSWQRRPGPEAHKGEGAFAASGTALATGGSKEAWFGTGGGGRARVFHSSDRGMSWSVSETPLEAAIASAGIFSIAFRDSKRGIVVGGDYARPDVATGTIALTEDGGHSWHVPPGSGLSGYRSAVAFSRRQPRWVLAVGSSGSDVSSDEGQRWSPLPIKGLNALAFSPDGTAWAVGGRGTIARLSAPEDANSDK